MARISLSKALKLKNRQVSRVNQLRNQINRANSHLAGSAPDFDVPELYAQLQNELAALWSLKKAINDANVPVHGTIYEMAEIKGQISWLKTVGTKRGRQDSGFGEPVEYAAQFDAARIAAEVEGLEARIDELQDVLDAHNATAQIDI